MAEKKYNKVLKLIKTWLGNTTTYGDDVERVGKKMFGKKFKGVFSSDNFPKIKTGYMIVNMDKSTEMGSHWVAFAADKTGYNIYDSFGRSTHKIFPNIGGRFNESKRDAEQSVLQNDCGQRCLAWLYVWDQFGKKMAMSI